MHITKTVIIPPITTLEAPPPCPLAILSPPFVFIVYLNENYAPPMPPKTIIIIKIIIMPDIMTPPEEFEDIKLF
jgi:hypothetical protein